MSEKLRAEWFWTDRWFGSSAMLLPLEAKGLYREMLTRAWSLGAKLPAEAKLIKKVVLIEDDEWDRCWPLVEPYWETSEDGKHIYNQTQQEVMSASTSLSEKRAKAGRKGGRRSGEVRRGEAKGSKTAKQTNPPSPSPSPSKDLDPDGNGKATADTVARLWAFWVKVFQMEDSPMTLTPKRRKKIVTRLKKYTPEQLADAIRGFAKHPWYSESSDRFKIETIFRSDERVQDGLMVDRQPKKQDPIDLWSPPDDEA